MMAQHVSIAHDGFAGDIIGSYLTREGKRGVVVQQDGTRVVHVYGEKWIEGQIPAGDGIWSDGGKSYDPPLATAAIGAAIAAAFPAKESSHG